MNDLAVQSDPGLQGFSADFEESDPLSWEGASSLLSGSSLRDFLRYCEEYQSDATRKVLGTLPGVSSHLMPQYVELRQIVQFFPGLGLIPGSEEGTEVEIFSEAVRGYIRHRLDRCGS